MYFWAKDLSFESQHFLLCNGHWKMMTFSSPGPHTQTRNKYTKRWPQYGRPIHWWRRTRPWSNEKLWEENWKPYVRDGVIEKWGRNRKKSLENHWKQIIYQTKTKHTKWYTECKFCAINSVWNFRLSCSTVKESWKRERKCWKQAGM